MKLTIGENIRNYRKRNDLTQEAFADRLGVTYQSVSRWENGATYPDLELIPAIATTLGVTVDELLGMPQMEKEQRAEETFDELRRECLKKPYDAERIVAVLRDIRRNYVDSESAWRPWCEGNSNVYRDPKILPEVRLLAEAYLAKEPMSPYVIQTMAVAEDEEHIDEFLAKHTTSFDCSERALRFLRYGRLGDSEKYEEERCYELERGFNTVLSLCYYKSLTEDKESEAKAITLIENLLTTIRVDAIDDRPDTWVDDRLGLALQSASVLVKEHPDMAIAKITAAVELLEETMKITDKITLPTSCSFLDGMTWTAQECWHHPNSNPDEPEERNIYIVSRMRNSNMALCTEIWPRDYWHLLRGEDFAPLHGNSAFEALCERVKALIVTR